MLSESWGSPRSAGAKQPQGNKALFEKNRPIRIGSLSGAMSVNVCLENLGENAFISD